MAAFSDYLENALVNHVLRNVALTSPATVYVALYTSDPTDADVGTEVTGGSYARQAATFSAPSNGVTSNSGTLTFPKATSNWGTVTHFGIRDANPAGNLLFYAALTSPKITDTDDQLVFDPGTLTVTLQ